MDRRSFLKAASTVGAIAAIPTSADALPEPGANENAVLVDTTLCVGCRACEGACAEQNKLPEPPPDKDLPKRRLTSPTAFTVVNQVEGVEGDHYVKRQCMHCVAPACASACPVRALDKKPNGPVAYDASKCMGCRYCMVACPFEIPKYQYDSPLPMVRKCVFCAERQDKGQQPACTEVCPQGTIKFGKRSALLEEARQRVYGNPKKYVQHIYGEHEAGGTNWMYISDIPFEKLDMKVGVNDTSYPSLVKGALGVPPIVMTLWPPLLMAMYAFSHRKGDKDE